MSLFIEPDHDIVEADGSPFIFPRDGNHSPAAFMCGLDPTGDPAFGNFTADGKLKVDATFSGSITIGDVSVLLKVGILDKAWNGVLNPDSTTYAGWVQDQRMSFTGGNLNVNLVGAQGSGLATEVTLENVFDGVRGLSPIQTTIARDVNDNVYQVVETDGILTKTSTITRNSDFEVTSIAEVTV